MVTIALKATESLYKSRQLETVYVWGGIHSSRSMSFLLKKPMGPILFFKGYTFRETSGVFWSRYRHHLEADLNCIIQHKITTASSQRSGVSKSLSRSDRTHSSTLTYNPTPSANQQWTSILFTVLALTSQTSVQSNRSELLVDRGNVVATGQKRRLFHLGEKTNEVVTNFVIYRDNWKLYS